MTSKAAINGPVLRIGRLTFVAIGACLAFGASSAEAQDARLTDGSHCAARSVAIAIDPLGLELLGLGESDGGTRVPFDRPCTGPLCSKAPAAPTPPPVAPPPSPSADPWALWADDLPAPTQVLRGAPSNDPDVRPIHCAAGVFHPPR